MSTFPAGPLLGRPITVAGSTGPLLSPSTDSNFRVTVAVDGQSLGEFDKCSGGDATATITKTSVGTQSNMVATLGGRVDHDDVVLEKKMIVGDKAGWETVRSLMARAGKSPVVVTKWPLDGNGVVAGKPIIHSGGRLMKVTPTSYDNDSTTVSTYQLTVTGGRWQ